MKKMDLNECTGRMGEVKTCCYTLYAGIQKNSQRWVSVTKERARAGDS